MHRAFQVLSRTYAKVMRLAANDQSNLKDREILLRSADFAEKMDQVIDACNPYRLNSNKHYKRPMSKENRHIQATLEDFAYWSLQWTIFARSETGEEREKRPPCFVGLSSTVQAFCDIYDDIKKEFPDFQLALALLNQDSVEHLFSKIRQRGGHCKNPTATMCRCSIRHILSTGFIQASKRANVQCPDAYSLINPESNVSREFATNTTDAKMDNSTPQETSSNSTSQIGDEEVMEELNGLIDLAPQLFAPWDSEDEAAESDTEERDEHPPKRAPEDSHYAANAIANFAGFVAARSFKKSKCQNCRDDMIKKQWEPRDRDEEYIEDREYSDVEGSTDECEGDDVTVKRLHRPSVQFREVVKFNLRTYAEVRERYWASDSLLERLCSIASTDEKVSEWYDKSHPCYKHRMDALSYLFLVKTYAQTRINNRKATADRLAARGSKKSNSNKAPVKTAKAQKIREFMNL